MRNGGSIIGGDDAREAGIERDAFAAVARNGVVAESGHGAERGAGGCIGVIPNAARIEYAR